MIRMHVWNLATKYSMAGRSHIEVFIWFGVLQMRLIRMRSLVSLGNRPIPRAIISQRSTADLKPLCRTLSSKSHKSQ